MSDVGAEIDALLDQAKRYWDVQDYAGLKSLWDMDEKDPYYQPEEVEELLVGWPAIEAYWATNTKIMDKITVSYGKAKAKLIAPDLAVAMFDLRWDAALKGRAPLGGDNRSTAIFRRKPEGWRFCHYIEAPLAPILYIRKLYEKDVEPAFRERLAREGQ
jgi:hypothetical protein